MCLCYPIKSFQHINALLTVLMLGCKDNRTRFPCIHSADDLLVIALDTAILVLVVDVVAVATGDGCEVGVGLSRLSCPGGDGNKNTCSCSKFTQ